MCPESDSLIFKFIHTAFSRSNVATSSFDPVASTTSSAGPTYSAAYLNELKAATPSSRPRIAEDEPMSYDADISMDTSAQTPQIVDLTGEFNYTLYAYVNSFSQEMMLIRKPSFHLVHLFLLQKRSANDYVKHLQTEQTTLSLSH